MCTPHLEKGMVGVIIADGDTANLDAARKVDLPPEAATMFDRLMAKAAR